MGDWKGRHIVSITDLTKEDLLHVLKHAHQLKETPQRNLLQGSILGTCFFEPSTRTRLSFESAMHRLDGNVIGFVDAKNTSSKKGETLEDTIRMVNGYVDVIAMRHPEPGSAARAAAVSSVPILNGGDGANQHPTQTLLDLFTIQECQGNIDGLKIAMVGDLKFGRTVHSLAQALSHFDVELHFVAPESLQMPKKYLDELTEHNVPYQLHESMDESLKSCDIVYMTRIQQERFDTEEEYEQMKGVYILNASMIDGAKNNMRIMHPLPRVNEITEDVDETEHAHYFEQAKNGVFVRQALLGLVLGKL